NVAFDDGFKQPVLLEKRHVLGMAHERQVRVQYEGHVAARVVQSIFPPAVEAGLTPAAGFGLNPAVEMGLNPAMRPGPCPPVRPGLNGPVRPGLKPAMKPGLKPMSTASRPGPRLTASRRRRDHSV